MLQFVLLPHNGGTRFKWLVNSDIRGSVPKWVLDAAVAGTCLDYVTVVKRASVLVVCNARAQRLLSDFLLFLCCVADEMAKRMAQRKKHR